MELKYTINISQIDDISDHLKKCSDLFIPALSTRINIDDYSTKLFEKSLRFEAWQQNELVGLIAAYLNEDIGQVFISNVSVLKSFEGKGIGGELLKMSIDFFRNKSVFLIKLEVNNRNIRAVKFYEKFKFKMDCSSDETTYLKFEV